MELFWYGDTAQTEPNAVKQLKGYSIFAIGNQTDQDLVKIYERIREQKWIRYELSWPQEWEITYSLIAQMAAMATKQCQPMPVHDYVTA